jgi:steroid delta-isomerase-like uncharacterized protein
MENLKDLVRPLYTDCFTANPRADAAALMDRLLADDFQSVNAAETKGKAQLIGQVQYFHKLIPDLKWDVQEMFEDGDRVIVRSLASGSPRGEFFGLQLDGTRSFRIMTIDVHTVERGRIKRVHHVEEWATAMQQLRA